MQNNKPTTLIDWWRHAAGRYAPLLPPFSDHETLVLDVCDVARKEVASAAQPLATANEIAGAVTWSRAGRPRFVLTDSMAAVLTATRAPPAYELPYEAFVIELPNKYLPASGPAGWATFLVVYSYVVEQSRATYFAFASDCMSDVTEAFGYAPLDLGIDEDGRTIELDRNEMESLRQLDGNGLAASVDNSGGASRATLGIMTDKGARLATRLIANLAAYVNQYRECVSTRNSHNVARPERIMEVRPPVNMVVSRKFREQAASLVAAGSFADARRVLRHMVRGHWKKQASGPNRSERKLIWVAPYLRGDDSLGTIEERAVIMDAPN